jgi:hypothetical protein
MARGSKKQQQPFSARFLNDFVELKMLFSKLRSIFDRKEAFHFWIRSLTPQSHHGGTGNALALRFTAGDIQKAIKTAMLFMQRQGSVRHCVETLPVSCSYCLAATPKIKGCLLVCQANMTATFSD